MNLTTLGIDIAKNVFHVFGVDKNGNKVLSKKISRINLPAFIANLPPALIGIEACGSAHHWARRFQSMGHQVRLMSPQYVKPYIKTNKNDEKDAEGICEAVTRPSMRFVPIKTTEQQDILLLHKIRSRLIKERTQLQNQIRGLLAEYGLIMQKGASALRKTLPLLLEDAENGLSPNARELFSELYEEYLTLETRISTYNKKLSLLAKDNEACKRLQSIPGIGEVTASALVGTIGKASVFGKGRHLSAFLGLVPRQCTSGGKERLLGISKRGNRYIRCLLIHGARAVVAVATRKTDKQSEWLKALVARKGVNVAVVALANKNARRAYALLKNESVYVN